MKIQILERSTERLIIHCRPTKRLYVICGIIFLILGIGVIGTLAKRISLSVNHQSVNYKTQFLSLFTTREFSCPSRDVKDVSLVSGGELLPTYLLQFSTAEKTMQADFTWADKKTKQQMVESCKDAMSKPDGNLEYVERGTLIGVSMGGACVGLGVLLFYLIQSATITMDRTRHQMVLVQQRWLPFFKTTKHVDLDNIRRIETQERMVETDGGHAICIEVAVTCNDGVVVSIANEHMFDKTSALELCSLLDAWLSSSTSAVCR